MSLDRYYNKEQVKGNTPTYGQSISPDDVSSVIKQETELRMGDVTGELIGGIKVDTSQEVHVYSSEVLIQSSYASPIKYNDNGTYPVLKVTPEKDIRDLGITQGVYSINYNFLNKFVKDCKIIQISSDRTEVKLVKKLIAPEELPKGATRNLPNAFEDLNTILSNDSILNSFSQTGILPNVILNFKNNEIYNVINYRFGGPSTGIINQTLQYPRGFFSYGTAVLSTTYVPIDTGVQQLGTWRTFIEVYTPAIGETLPSGLNYGTPTGRARKFLLKINQNSDGDVIWQQGTNIFGTGGLPLPPEVTFDPYGNIVVSNPITPNTILSLEYEKYAWGPSSLDEFIVKLDRPLANSIEVNDTLDVDGQVYDSYIEKIVAFPLVTEQNREDFSQPDFSLDMSDLKGAEGTGWKTWDTLLDVNATTSQQLIDHYFSGSLGNVKLNIDYSDFTNFIHFSSATERVDNFFYKVQQIETYNNRINTLQSVSGSEAITNISQSVVRRDRLIGGFDDFEHYLYYSSISNNYTHWSSSANIIEPYPKASTFPHVLHPSTSSQGEVWYSGVYSSASLYDEFNDARLRNMIPIHLQEDERNSEYITFVDMIGQHFDIQWTYIKSLTDINRREEHPKDGMADEILKSVAESFGWKLSNGYSDVSLWKYALGVESDGTQYQSGNLESKARQQITEEIWRRILNNLPMLYKTKGSARSIKAILSAYGIPQAFLKIREWGGPTISTRKNVYEHERFINKLELSPSKYLTTPWDDINSDRPNSIEIIGKMPKQNYHIFRLSDGGDNIDYFWDYVNDTARIRLAINGTNIISSSYVPYKLRRDAVFVLTSGSIDIQAGWVDDWGNLLANPTASLVSPNSTFNSVWTSTGTLQVPGPTADSNVNSYETASIQEVRYYRDSITNEIVTEHARNTEAYFSDDNTTDLDIDTSFDKLMFRIFPDSQVATTSSYISSAHPNQRITQSDSGLVLSASLTNITSNQLVGEVDTQFVTVPSMGALNLMNNKIRIESTSLKGQLNPDKSYELSEFDYAPVDSNLLGTYFTTTDTVNFDIYNSEGYFEADDWVGDPDKRYNDDYPLVKFRAKNYFQKYTSGTAIDLILDMLSRYDMSVFEQIKQLLPARVDWHKGILIEPHIFERNKYRRNRDITISRHMYDGSISMINHELTASRNDYDPAEIDLYDYLPSTYKYLIPTLTSSVTCTTSSANGATGSSLPPSGSIDYMLYNSQVYNITYQHPTKPLFEFTPAAYSSGSTARFYYSSSFDGPSTLITNADINGNAVTSSITTTISYTSSVSSSGIISDGDSTLNFNISTWGYESPPHTLTNPYYDARPVNIICKLNDATFPGANTNIFAGSSTGSGTLTYAGGAFSIDLSGNPLTINNGIDPAVLGDLDLQLRLDFESSSVASYNESSEYILLKTGEPNWHPDVDQFGNISFNDGSGDKTYQITDRITDRIIRIDTSSYAPNTSGSSAVSAEYEYTSSTYQEKVIYTNNPNPTCVSSSTYINVPNGYWQYSPTGSTVLNHRSSKIYKVPKYFYTSSISASLKLPSSSSMEWWEGQDDRLPLALENLYYNGCRISSDSLTTDSTDTPDGGPVVEITTVDPNVLVYSTQTISDSGTQIGTSGGTSSSGNVKKTPDDVLQSVNLKNKKRKNTSVITKATEFKVLNPLSFKPKTSTGIVLRPAPQNEPLIISRLLSQPYSIYGGTHVYLLDPDWDGLDWKKLTRVAGASFDMIVNGISTTKGSMLPSNTIQVRNVSFVQGGSYVGQSTLIIHRVYLIQKSTGTILYTQENPVNAYDKTFTYGYNPFDLEVRVVVST